MAQPDKKLDKFKSAVLKDAQEQREKILEEINDFRNTEMEKAEEDILHETYIMIQNEITAIKNQQSRKISLAELDGRRKLLKLREEITDKVFKETAARILDFSKTAEYITLICESAKTSCNLLPEGDIIIQVKKSDLAHTEKLIAASSRTATVEENADIVLGGVIIINRDKGLVINETLDLKLMSQKDWYTGSSGLTLEL